MANSQTIPLSYWIENKLNCFIYPEVYKEEPVEHKEVSSIIYTFMIETMNFQKPSMEKLNGCKQNGFRPRLGEI